MGDLGAFFGSLNPGDIGFASLVVAGIWLIFTGRLVPRSTVDAIKIEAADSIARVRHDADATVARYTEEKREWKEAYYLEHSAREKLGDQLTELIELAETTEQLIRSITATHSGGGGS